MIDSQGAACCKQNVSVSFMWLPPPNLMGNFKLIRRSSLPLWIREIAVKVKVKVKVKEKL